jgi:hypothetical protein
MMLVQWQKLLLLVVLISAAGTLTELFLLEHTEEVYQLIPVGLLGLVLISTLLVLIAPRSWSVTLFRGVLILCLMSAAVGLYLHYIANVEFVLERHPRLSGVALFKSAMMGGMPALAPGAMAQIALIGLLATWPRPAA